MARNLMIILLFLAFVPAVVAQQLFVKKDTKDEDGYVGHETQKDVTFLTCDDVELAIEKGDHVKETPKTCGSAKVGPFHGKIEKFDSKRCKLSVVDRLGIEGTVKLDVSECLSSSKYRRGRAVTVRVDSNHRRTIEIE